MLLLWPGEERRKRRDDFGRNGPALFAANISDQSIKKISSTSYYRAIFFTNTALFCAGRLGRGV